MFEYTERELQFLHKWIKEIMDVKMNYEILKPEPKNNRSLMDTELYIKITTDEGYLKHRICLTVEVLKFCTREDLFD